MKNCIIFNLLIICCAFIYCKNSDEKGSIVSNTKIQNTIGYEDRAKWEIYKYNMSITDITIDSGQKIDFLECDLHLLKDNKDSIKIEYIDEDTLTTLYFQPLYNGLPIEINIPNVIEFFGVSFKGDSIKYMRCCDRNLATTFQDIYSKSQQSKLLDIAKNRTTKVNPWIREFIKKNRL